MLEPGIFIIKDYRMVDGREQGIVSLHRVGEDALMFFTLHLLEWLNMHTVDVELQTTIFELFRLPEATESATFPVYRPFTVVEPLFNSLEEGEELDDSARQKIVQSVLRQFMGRQEQQP